MSEKVFLSPREKLRLPDEDERNAVRLCPKCGRVIPIERESCAFCSNTGEIRRPAVPLRKKLILLGLIAAGAVILLLGVDLAVRIAGPLAAPVTATATASGIQGTSVPVILLP